MGSVIRLLQGQCMWFFDLWCTSTNKKWIQLVWNGNECILCIL